MNCSRWLRALDGLLSLVYPCFCKICEAFVAETRGASICPACWDRVRLIEDPVCEICGLPLPPAYGSATTPPRCGDCLFDTYPFARARAAAHYEQTLRELIHLFKFNRRRDLARPLSDLLFRAYLNHRAALAADLIVAVPLHPSRRRERGFNQSELLARRLARRTGLRFAPGVLLRTRATPSQTGLHKKARARNVRRAFVVSAPAKVGGQAVLLIDDVFTTGATLSECARTLRDAGARAVHVLTVARVSPS